MLFFVIFSTLSPIYHLHFQPVFFCELETCGVFPSPKILFSISQIAEITIATGVKVPNMPMPPGTQDPVINEIHGRVSVPRNGPRIQDSSRLHSFTMSHATCKKPRFPSKCDTNSFIYSKISYECHKNFIPRDRLWGRHFPPPHWAKHSPVF